MKLSKKVALAANDDIQEKIGFKPALDTTLKTEDLYKELYKKTLELEIDEEDREDLEDATCEVIDALAEKFPTILLNKKGEAVEEDSKVEEAEVVEDAPKGKKDKKGKKSKKVKEEVVEEAEEEEVPEEKPAKKAKGKKAKEVKEEVIAPAKPAKKAKGKKGKVDPAELAEEIKTNKKISRDELYAVVEDNADLFGANAETLLAITNPMVLKKQMRNVLEGGEVTMTKTKAPAKKEKKEKVVEPTLTEKVNAADDLIVLKAIAKAFKDSFPGVKAKKFDKVKKLRKAMLEVIVEKAPKNKKGKTAGADLETIRAERQKRVDWITDFINEAGGSVGRKKLTAKALEEFPNPAKAIRDMISYAKNPKYNKFEKLMVEVDGVIGWEGKLDTTPKKSKAKKAKEEEVVAPVKEEKKGKKGKKDKKNKKGKKSKK